MFQQVLAGVTVIDVSSHRLCPLPGESYPTGAPT